MSFGPEVTVRYADPRPGKVGSVRLGHFSPRQAQPLFPFPSDDPTLPFIEPVANYVRSETPLGYMLARILPKDVVGWGIWEQDRLLGFIEMARKEESNRVVSFAVVLEPNARQRGAGPLAVAGALHFAFSPNQLAKYLNGFSPLGAAAIHTLVSPPNERSLTMCERLGFERRRQTRSYTGSTWLELVLPAPDEQIYRPEGFLFD